MNKAVSLEGSADQTTRTLGVLIADPDPIVRFGLSDILKGEDDLEVVGEAGTHRELLEALESRRPDVLILEPALGDVPGHELLRSISERFGRIHTLVFTHRDTDLGVMETLRLGVEGFLAKRVSPEIILQAVRTVADGRHYLDPAFTSLLVGQVKRHGERRRPGARQLNDRERAVLKLLVDGRRNREISEILCISERTVKFHLRTLFQKLRVTNRTEAVVAAIKHGLAD